MTCKGDDKNAQKKTTDSISVCLHDDCGGGCCHCNHSDGGAEHGCNSHGNCKCDCNHSEIKHVFQDSETCVANKGVPASKRIPLRTFIFTNMQTAYQCVLTDIFVEKSLLSVWAYPVFMRHDYEDTFMIYLSYQYPLVKIMVDSNYVITDMVPVEENQWKLATNAMTVLKSYIGFQLVLPRRPD